MRWSNKPHPGIKPHRFQLPSLHNSAQSFANCYNVTKREVGKFFCCEAQTRSRESPASDLCQRVKEVLELCSRVFLLQIYIHLRVGALFVKLVKYCVCVCVCVCNRLFLMSLLSAGYCVSMFGSTEARRTVNAFPCCCCKKPNRVKKGSNLGHNCSALKSRTHF